MRRATALARAVRAGQLTDGAWASLEGSTEEDFLEILELSRHQSPEVRECSAKVLPHFALTGEAKAQLADALVVLCNDSAADVRYWAFVGLGTLRREFDGDAVRQALAAGLGDADPQVASEALMGLALRRDVRAATWLREAVLQREAREFPSEWIGAAAALGETQLHDSVIQWARDAAPDEDFAEAAVRLTDPRGLGHDLFSGLADFVRLRSSEPDQEIDLRWWRICDTIAKLAPWQLPTIRDEVAARLSDNALALQYFAEILTNLAPSA